MRFSARCLCLLAFLPFVMPAGDDDWLKWRGPDNNGVARGDAPLTWSDKENIAWKVPVAGKGHSSPVIWGNRIFLTAAVQNDAPPAARAEAAPAEGPGGRRGGPRGGPTPREHKFVVLCIDRTSGKTIWEKVALMATPHESYHPTYGSFASHTVVTDGKMVWASFGSRGLYAYDFEGRLVWKKDVPPMRMRMQFGEGAAPVLDGNTLYLKYDQTQGSYLLAVDKKTGKELWRADRGDVSDSWSQPLVVTHEGVKQLVVSGTPKTRAYNPETGAVIWEAVGLGANVIPAPVAANGMVFVMSGFRDPKLLAIRLGRTGDLTGTDAIVWTNERGNSYTPSPVLHDGKLYFLTDNGMLSCFDAATGKPFYQQQRLPKPYNFKASPVAANGKLYLSAENGDVIVVALGGEFRVLATNTLTDQVFIATPAVVAGTMYLRSQDSLFAVRGGK
ncbi:MAG: PQQ-binding-like beta-propeller repeat protein [Bryobacteraceae bacterium]|nr:PQQ-binding-like beta-propeller repeat protein [Bryobacteraceae bacterium]